MCQQLIPIAEDPPVNTQPCGDLHGAAQLDQISLPTTHKAVEATVLGVVQHASSNSSEKNSGAFFDRQVALIEVVRPRGTTIEANKTEPNESVSEPMVINTASPLSPSHQTIAEENKMGSSELGAISKAQKYSKNN